MNTWQTENCSLSSFLIAPSAPSVFHAGVISFDIIQCIPICITPTLAAYPHYIPYLEFSFFFLSKTPLSQITCPPGHMPIYFRKISNANVLICMSNITYYLPEIQSDKLTVRIIVTQRKNTNIGKFQINLQEDGVLGQGACLLMFFQVPSVCAAALRVTCSAPPRADGWFVT